MGNPFDAMRKQLEKMYFGKCDVYEYVKTKNEQTKITSPHYNTFFFGWQED